MYFSQCSLFHGAHNLVQVLLIIQLNIKTRKFWKIKTKTRHLPLPSALSVPKAITFLVNGTSFSPKIHPPTPTTTSEISSCLSTDGPTSQDLRKLQDVGLSWKVVIDHSISKALGMFFTFLECSPFGYFVSTETTSTAEKYFSSGLLLICCAVNMLGQHLIACYFPF